MTEREMGDLLRATLALSSEAIDRLHADLAERRRREMLWRGYLDAMRLSHQTVRETLARSYAAAFPVVRYS